MWKKLTFFLFLLLSIISNAQVRYKFRNYTISDGLSQSAVLTIVQDDLYSLWIGTQDGLNRFNGQKFDEFNSFVTPEIKNDFFQCSYKDENGNLWFGTHKGLVFYDLYKNEFKTFYVNQKSRLNNIISITGNEDHIYLVSSEGDLYSFDKKNKSFRKEKFNQGVITNILLVEGKDLLLSTKEGRVFFQKKGTWEEVRVKSKADKLKINNIRNFPEGTFLATSEGVFKISFPIKEAKIVELSINDMNITDLFIEEEVGWVIGTGNNGLYIIKEGEVVEHCVADAFQENSIVSNNIATITKDKAGTFWIGTLGGLSNFDPKNKGFYGVGPSIIPHKGLPSKNVWCFAENDAGDLHIGQDFSLSKLDDKSKKFIHFFF